MKKIFFVISLMLLLVDSTGFSKDAPAPEISFEEKTFDAGEIKSGDYLEHTFKFYNKGNANLEISDVKTG
ncbi:MAG: DUF1573 domain-containing protein [Deltaproteobacteria bacterium]|nr:DUF1573 domain-containing protein [Deltaproteobacteria bacterium]